jgi:hypothetical protein
MFSMGEPQLDIDGMTKFLQTDGWSFGWDRVVEKGISVWRVHAEKGGKRYLVCDRNLAMALNTVKQMVLSQN